MNAIQKKTAISAFLTIYFIWGSTYLAIRYAIETLPPWFLSSSRFFLAAAIMALLAWYKKEGPLSKEEKQVAAFSGLFLIAANAIVGVVEQWIASGIVAVVIGAMPIWIMLIGWSLFGQRRPTVGKIAGALLGLAGIGIIASAGNHDGPIASASANIGYPILFFSSCLWAVGTLMQRKVKNLKSVLTFSSVQMFSGAILAGVASLLLEQPWAIHWAEVKTTSVAAYFYLVIFGSVISFSAYSWLSRNVEPHLVSTYALVNPLIAVALGWLCFAEPITLSFLAAIGLVLSGITLLIKT